MIKRCAFLVLLMAAVAHGAEPNINIRLDLQEQSDGFEVTVHQADTPLVRAYLYNDGEKWQGDTNWSGQFNWFTNYYDSTTAVSVAGTVDVNTNWIDFQFSSANCNTNGEFFAQVVLTNSTSSRRYVFGDGRLQILRNPSRLSGNPLVMNNLPTGVSTGDVAYYNGTDWARLAPGTDGTVLTTHSTTGAPTWSAVSAVAGSITNASGGTAVTVSRTGDQITINHSNTSDQASIDNTGGSVIQDLLFDSLGHVTNGTSLDLDTRYYTETEADAKYPILANENEFATSNRFLDNVYIQADNKGLYIGPTGNQIRVISSEGALLIQQQDSLGNWDSLISTDEANQSQLLGSNVWQIIGTATSENEIVNYQTMTNHTAGVSNGVKGYADATFYAGTTITMPQPFGAMVQEVTNTFIIWFGDAVDRDTTLVRFMGGAESGSIQGCLVEGTTNAPSVAAVTNLAGITIDSSGISSTEYTNFTDGTWAQWAVGGFEITNGTGTNIRFTVHTTQVIQ